DTAYKTALENLSRKEAYLQANPPKEEIPDMSVAEPNIYLEEPMLLKTTPEEWEKEVTSIAEVLREFRELQDWSVEYIGVSVNKRFINSEGSRTLSGYLYQYLEVKATAQASDGQRLSNFYRIALRDDDPLPAREKLTADVRKMAIELQEMVSAPALDEYAGPVLFEGYAAAQFFSQLFISQLSPALAPLVAEEWIKDQLPDSKLAGKLNRRIFPEFITVTDEPSRKKWEGAACLGHRSVDDEGVPCRDIALVKAGRLTTLPMTRRPIKKLAETNGHARSLQNQWTVPGITTLVIKSDKTNKDLHNELRRLCKEFGNEYGLLITRIDDPDVSRPYQWTEQNNDGNALLTSPIIMYCVYADDGRIEPVRGLGFDEVTIRSLRDVVIMGKDPKLFNFRQTTGFSGIRYPASIITPSILIEEMEFKDAMIREPLPLTQNPIFLKE
ncbi:hypothetical protein KKG66_06560, partial [bacterium]|nr:hypothetical protein [bacterium]